jgi:ribosomal protein S18 acetylase RimI-like enzyme
MKIRKATEKDLNIIAKFDQGYGLYENSLDKRLGVSKIAELKKVNKKFMRLGTLYFIAEEKGIPLGFIDINFRLQGKEHTGVIHTLFVKEDARGKGIGKILVQHVLKLFKKNKCTRIASFSHAANKNAQAFWKKNGFELEEGFHLSKRLKK